MWLDRRSFRWERNPITALGLPGTIETDDYSLPGWWDVSSTRDLVQNASVWFGGKEEWIRKFEEIEETPLLPSKFAYSLNLGRLSAEEFSQPFP